LTLPITPGAYRPGSMAQGAKVGEWRQQRPDLVAERCDGCLACWIYCPDSAIRPEEGIISFDLTFCKGCGICAKECPREAITMKEEPHGY
jgi:pyruvate ferredoxin oxidoreductase delta subunit